MSLVRGENSLFFAIGLDNDQLEKDAQAATEIIGKSAKELSVLSKEAASLLKAQLKESLGKNWLKESFDINALKASPFFDQLGKLMGGELRFKGGEFDKLKGMLNASKDDIEATAALMGLLEQKIAQMGASSSNEMRKLSQGVKIVSDHLKDMGVNTQEVYRRLEEAAKYNGFTQNPLAHHLRSVHQDNQRALNTSSLSSLGSLKSTLSGVLGKDLSLSKVEFASLNALLHKSKDHFEELIVLLGFFKEKIAQSPKEGAESMEKLSHSLRAMEGELKKCGVSLEAVFGGIHRSSPVDPKAAGKIHELTSELNNLQKAQEGLLGTGSSLQGQLRQSLEAMAALKLEGRDSSLEYERLAQRAAELKGALASVNRQTSSASLGKEGLSSVISSVNGLVGIFGAAQGAIALFGGEGKKTEAALVKLNGVLAILNSLSAVQTSLHDKNSLSFKALCYVQGLYATALNASAAATVRLAAATKLLGWGLVIGAVAAAASALQRFSRKLAEKNKLARLSVDIDKEAKKGALSEQIHLKMLFEQAKSEIASKKDRLHAIRELLKFMPGLKYFLNLETIHSQKAAAAVEAHAKALEKRARARALEDKITRNEEKRIEELDKAKEDHQGLFSKAKLSLRRGVNRFFQSIALSSPGVSVKAKEEAVKLYEEQDRKIVEDHKKSLAENLHKINEKHDKENNLLLKIGKEKGLLDFSGPEAEAKDYKEKETRAQKERQLLEKHQRELKKRQEESQELAAIQKDSLNKKEALDRQGRLLIIKGLKEGLEKEKALLKISLEEKKQVHKKEYEDRLKHINKLGQLSEKEKAPAIAEIRGNREEADKIAEGEYREEEKTLEIKFDPRSLSGMSEQLKIIEELKNKSVSKEEVASLNEQKAALEAKMALLQGISPLELSGLDIKKQSLEAINKELEKQREIVKEKQKAYDLAVKKHGAASPEAIVAQKKLNQAQGDELKLLDVKREKLAAVGKTLQSSAEQLKSLLASFGMDGNSAEGRKINTMLDFASGAGEALAGVAMKNPMALISGAVKAMSALFKTHVVSDTQVYEDHVRSLADAFAVLSAQMEHLRGEDKFKNYDDQIKNQIDQIEERKKAIRAEMRARKENFFGDKGSATDWKKVAEFEKANKLAEQALKKLEKQKKEAFLGLNEGNLMESFLLALEKGKEAMSSFEEGFDDMIKKVFLNKIKTQYLEKQLAELWEDMAQKAESAGGIDEGEFYALKGKAREIFEGARRRTKETDKLLEGLDITGGLFGDKKERKEGLSGAIKAVTEETADKLAGTLNHMRVTQTQSLAAQERMCAHLAGIHSNSMYLKNLVSMDKRLAVIEGAFLSKEAAGR